MPKLKRPDGTIVSVSKAGREALLKRGYTDLDAAAPAPAPEPKLEPEFDAAAFVAEHTADEVIDRAGDDPSIASRLLIAEQQGKNRKTVVEKLSAGLEA